jgi:hypothetical protein
MVHITFNFFKTWFLLKSSVFYILEVCAYTMSNTHVKWVYCHHGMARPRVADRGDGLQIWRVAANILNKQSRTADNENRVLRRIFGHKRDEVMGEWRKLHNEERHNLYSSPDIIRQVKSRRMRWAGHVSHMGEEKKVYKVLVGKPEGKRPLGRPRRRWEDGIRMDLREIGLRGCGLDSTLSGQDRWMAVGFLRHGVS